MDDKELKKILRQADDALVRDKWQEIVRLLEPIKDELDFDSKSDLAFAYNNLDQYEKVVAFLEPIKKALPPDSKSDLAFAYNNLGQYEKTIALLEPDKETLPPEGKTNLAFAYNNLDQYEKVVAFLEPIKKALPPEGKSNLAFAYNNLGQFTKVLKLLEPIIVNLPLIGKGTLVTVYINLGQFMEAIIFVMETNEPGLTEIFITDLLITLKMAILSKTNSPLLGDSVIKEEIVELFFNTYLQRNLSLRTLHAEHESLYSQICILALLRFDEILRASYYCSATTYGAMFSASDENEFELRINEVGAFNDPLEGKMLSYNKASNINEAKIFIKCFSLRHNNLNQFRLYGGIVGRADGMSLVFNPTFFSQGLTRLNILSERKEQQWPLYRVCYLNPVGNEQVASKSYQIHGLAKEDTVDYFLNHPEANYNDYVTNVILPEQKLIAKIAEFLKKVGTIYIPYLPYLFKHKAFLDEAECRIIDFKNKTTSSSDEKWISYEVNVLNHLDEVDFGPSLKDKAYWQSYFEEHEITVNLNADLSFK